MKSCPNCRTIYEDDYNGTCAECGKGLAGVAPNGSPDLQFKYASQVAQGRREAELERAMKAGRFDGVQVQESVLGVAQQFARLFVRGNPDE